MTTTDDGCATSTAIDSLELAGRAAIVIAEHLWSLDIIDPPIGSKDKRAKQSLQVINQIIDRNGWGGNIKYRGNGPPQWCGMFAGYCWAEAGLDASWLPTYFASTYRLWLWGAYRNFETGRGKQNTPPPADHGLRLCESLQRGVGLSFQPRPGDIVIVGDGNPSVGDHVTLCVSYDPARRVFETLSGNGGGVGPGGERREGISRREYTIDAATGYRAMWLYRPAMGDLRAGDTRETEK